MDDTVRKYVERALELADRRDDALGEEELADIARELGLTDEDLARVAQAVEDHVDRARGYADHQMWDEAIRELEEASALAPSRPAIRLALAEAHAGRWTATDIADDKVRAESLARNVLGVDPKNQTAFAVLAKLSPPAEAPKSRAGLVAGLVIALGVVLTLLWFVVDVPEPNTTPAWSPVPAVPARVVTSEQTGEIDIPVSFGEADGLSFRARRSRLARYPGRAFYTLWGEVEVTGDLELQELDVRVKLLDAKGAVLTTKPHDAWGTHQARLRKGDRGIFAVLVEIDHRAASAQVEIGVRETMAASGPYVDPPVVVASHLVTIPDHLKVEIRERHAGFSPFLDKGKGFFKATWEFRNVGKVPIRMLRYELTIFDASNKPIDSKRRLVTYSSFPAMEPGDVFLEATTNMIPSKYSRYELAIVEIE